MDDPAVILKWFFLGLMYIFFFSILRATWSGSTTRVALQKVESRKNKGGVRSDLLPDPPASAARSVPRPDRLVVLEPQELVGTEYILRDELSIGRSSSCHISLQDVFISQLHARVMLEAGDVIVEDLGSTNGTYVNRERLQGSVKIGAGDRVQVGGIVMELR